MFDHTSTQHEPMISKEEFMARYTVQIRRMFEASLVATSYHAGQLGHCIMHSVETLAVIHESPKTEGRLAQVEEFETLVADVLATVTQRA